MVRSDLFVITFIYSYDFIHEVLPREDIQIYRLELIPVLYMSVIPECCVLYVNDHDVVIIS
jgi:hypothetical protein